MFEGIGKNAVDGAVKRIGELASHIKPGMINNGLAKLAVNIPVLGILVRGFNAMSEEEQAEFVKNALLAGAALAAKNGGKVSF